MNYLSASLLILTLVGCAPAPAPLFPTQPANAVLPSPASTLETLTPSPTPQAAPLQGLAGLAAPPAPAQECRDRVWQEADSFLFECQAGEQRLRYRYTPATGSLHDLTVQLDERPPFYPSFYGGPIFLFGDRQIPIWDAETLTLSHAEPLLSADGLEITWRAALGEQEIAYTYRLSLHGRTLRLQATSPTAEIPAFSFDRSEETPGARLLSIPYLATFDLLFYDGLFLSAYFDWTQSNASYYEKVSEPYSERSFHFSQMAFYQPDTDGQRQPLHEVLYLTVSDRLADVLPALPNPPSPHRATLAGRTVVDFWAEEPFAETQARVQALHERGLTDLLLIRHPWQRCGYDDCYPSVLPARAEWGGDSALQSLSQAARRAGDLFALHENYVDVYPNADRWSPDDLALDPQGDPRPAWFNQTTGQQAYLLSPFRALEIARPISPEIHRRYATSAAFLDVHTAVPPWEKTDYRAEQAGSARFGPVFQAYIDLLTFLRAAHQGPVLSEGGAHFLYAGWVDGVEAEYQDGLDEGHTTPPLVDFALLRLHPLMVNYGVGYFPRYFSQAGQLKWGGYTLEDQHHYLATQIAFCHAGYIDSPELFDSAEDWLAWVERTARLVAPIHQRCAAAQAVRILYRVDGALAPVEQAIAAQELSQVFVQYDNGLQVYVNRHPDQPWPVDLAFTPSWAAFSALVDETRQDFVGTPHNDSFLLPPNGWLAVMP